MYAEEARKMILKIVFQAESVKDQKRSMNGLEGVLLVGR